MASNMASNVTVASSATGGPGSTVTAVQVGHTGQIGGQVGPGTVTSGSSGSTIVAGSIPAGIPPGVPTPVFHHEFLDAASAAAAVCFCHRFLNPFGGGPMFTTTGYVLTILKGYYISYRLSLI